jgi:hypothetical protein
VDDEPREAEAGRSVDGGLVHRPRRVAPLLRGAWA